MELVMYYKQGPPVGAEIRLKDHGLAVSSIVGFADEAAFLVLFTLGPTDRVINETRMARVTGSGAKTPPQVLHGSATRRL